MTQPDTDFLSMWTVYDHPTDYPEGFIARRWAIGKGTMTATAEVMLSADLDGIRDAMTGLGLTPLPRQDGDDPCIVETWL